jgi:anti-sigma B factor antagonist
MPPFKLAEREISPEAREIQIHGELDLAVANQLKVAISSCGAAIVLIDLERCEFIDSTGIAVIVRAHNERLADGGRVVVHSPRAQVLRVLTVTGLTQNGLVFGDREEVLGAPDGDGVLAARDGAGPA